MKHEENSYQARKSFAAWLNLSTVFNRGIVSRAARR